MAVAAHLNTTYCGLLKQPDNQKLAKLFMIHGSQRIMKWGSIW